MSIVVYKLGGRACFLVSKVEKPRFFLRKICVKKNGHFFGQTQVVNGFGGKKCRHTGRHQPYIYIYAFRPICCLLFLAEKTHFAYFGGKRRRFKDNKNACLARFGVHFFCAIFDNETGEILTFLGKM